MDNQMPEMDGVETVRNIREREVQSGRKRTHIVACSASAMAGDREYFLAAGMDSYLGKPFCAEALYAAIREAALQPVS
jgi:CheY-like chemotaxis protein